MEKLTTINELKEERDQLQRRLGIKEAENKILFREGEELRRKLNVDLGDTFEIIAAKKKGNKELAIFYAPDDGWAIHLGNPSRHVMLGEVEGDIVSWGRTLGSAIKLMKSKLDKQ